MQSPDAFIVIYSYKVCTSLVEHNPQQDYFVSSVIHVIKGIQFWL